MNASRNRERKTREGIRAPPRAQAASGLYRLGPALVPEIRRFVPAVPRRLLYERDAGFGDIAADDLVEVAVSRKAEGPSAGRRELAGPRRHHHLDPCIGLEA